MKYQDIKITMKEGFDLQFDEASVAIDPTGFLVFDTGENRTFINLEDIKSWGYSYEEEPDEDDNVRNLFSIDGGNNNLN